MDSSMLEQLGAIAMPKEDHYVVHLENLSAVVSTSLEHNAQVNIIGRTSSNPGAAYIVTLVKRPPSEMASEEFFRKPVGRAGLSQALLDVVERRS